MLCYLKMCLCKGKDWFVCDGKYAGVARSTPYPLLAAEVLLATPQVSVVQLWESSKLPPTDPPVVMWGPLQGGHMFMRS